MEKIKNSAGMKAAASIILVVSLIALAVTSLFGLVMINENIYGEDSVKRLRDDAVMDILLDYENKAVRDYYEQGILGGASYHLDYYKDYFSEENCNYFFIIEPLESDGMEKEDFPTLSNYECKDYMYSNTSQYYLMQDSDIETFKYNVTIDELRKYDAYYEGSYYDESYYDGSYYDVEYQQLYFDGDMEAALCSIPDFQKKYTKFMDNIADKHTDYGTHSYYDEENQQFCVDVSYQNWLIVQITSFVKSNLTAHDNFYTSMPLRFLDEYADDVFPAVLPVFVISLIVSIAMTLYLFVAAGHRKEKEGITLSLFDKIPYDIIVVAYMGLFLALVEVSQVSYGTTYIGWAVLITLSCIMAPSLLVTTATRVKARTIITNTLVVRVCKWLLKSLKKYSKKSFGIIKYLWQNLDIYWKFLGVFAIVSFLEFIVIVGVQDIRAILLFWFFEKVILGFVLVVAVINMNKLKVGAAEIAKGNTDYEVETDKMFWEFKNHGEQLNSIRNGIQSAVEERMKSERMKTELITNVSHDIKTPLTSIINYVDLLEKENIENENATEYLSVLDRQSARLKKLIQDLIDASKASTGNIPVELGNNDVRVLLEQALGEFSERLERRGLKPVVTYHTDNTMAIADGKLLWRVFDNLINNIVKYAQDNTRVYIDIENDSNDINDESGYTKRESKIRVTFKNISNDELNVTGDELMERFVRGDSSRNTEGSGLGLSIARSLMEIQNGKLEIKVDGDLFKVVLLLARA